MRRCVGLVVLLWCVTAWAAAPPVRGPLGFTKEHKEWLTRSNAAIGEADAAGRFADAEKSAREQLAFRAKIQGPWYWQTRELNRLVEEYKRLADLPDDKRRAAHQGRHLANKGVRFHATGRPKEAEPILRESLKGIRAALGDHPLTATACNNLAACLGAQGKAERAIELFEEALAIRRKALGEDNAETGLSYANLAAFHDLRGRPDLALPLYQKALASYRKGIGGEHPETGATHNSIGMCLQALNRLSEARPSFETALDIYRRRFGLDHVKTAAALNNVAYCLQADGDLAQAEALYEKSLAVRLKRLGEDSLDVATSYNNLAVCLYAQGRTAQAMALLEKAFAIRSRLLPEDDLDVATGANNLAACLLGQGKAALAMPLFERALEIRKKRLGENHRHTADSYNNLAVCLTELGEADRALPFFEKCLAARQKGGGDLLAIAAGHLNLGYCHQTRKKPALAVAALQKALALYAGLLGDDHPNAARSRDILAWCRIAQDKPALALPLARKALASRAKMLGEDHPSTAASSSTVAVCLWNQGRYAEAARLWQASLAGLEASRSHRAASGFDRAEADAVRFPHRPALAVALAKLGQPANAFSQAEASLARGLLDDLAAADSSRPAIPTLPLERIQQALPADAALVLWIDVAELHEHWACVVRRTGKPHWERLAGAGEAGAWTADDESLAARLRAALRDMTSTRKKWSGLVEEFAAQRFAPLRPHLKAAGDLPEVKRLFVVPAGAMAYIPAELFAEKYAVRYVPSGSVLARLTQGHRKLDGSSLLALGDPVFDPPVPPEAGVLVKGVRPGSPAAKAGLKGGDVLLSVGGSAVESADDLAAAFAKLPAAAAAWRAGKDVALRLESKPLGADFDRRPPRDAIRAWRQANAPASAGTGHKRLKGTAYEVEAIASLVKGVMKLEGSAASEQKLDEMREKGELKKFRILHIATHGEPDERAPGRSALILAQDALPDPAEQARSNRHVYDGRLTVSRIYGGWELDADLVVLSACGTGLGKDAGGEGLLGFSQAFLSRGARAVVVSRWQVDDAATSLLMHRFYQNLLGKRDGKQMKPMGRAAALREASEWLRSLSAPEAETARKSLPRGSLTGGPKVTAKTYEHPYFWAAFTLIGDPD